MSFRAWLAGLAIAVSCVATSAAPAQSKSGQLEAVLNSMDKAAATDKTIECTFTKDQYTKIVNDTDTQDGTMYFRHTSDGVEMAAHIDKPDVKIVVVSNG